MDPKAILIVLLGSLVFYVAALSVTHYSLAMYATMTLFFIALSIMPLFVRMGKTEDEN